MRVHPPRPLPALTVLGVVFALLALHQSMAPTLLTRTWYFQGLVTGASMALGYAVGTLLQLVGGSVVRGVERLSGRTRPQVSEQRARQLDVGFMVVVVVLAVAAVAQSISDRRWTWERLGQDTDHGLLTLLGTGVVAVLVLLLVAGLVRAVKWLLGRATRLADLVFPRWIAAGLAIVVVAWFVAFSLNNWVYQRTINALNEAFTLSDGQVQDDLEPPTSTVRSAGPESEVEWDQMGREGRRFVSSGPSTDDIAAIHPSGAVEAEPIRVFVGREQAEDPDDRAALALDEMERFGAFARDVVLVVIPTGTGWVNEQTVQPLEYMYAGNVATVSMQYSHLPSPLAFLTEAQAAQDAGEALIGAVTERIESMPESERPTLAVSGESLGTFGASGAFESLEDLLASTDASLWTGPPGTVHLRRQAEDERVAGSLQIHPVWKGGDTVVFANRPSEVVEHQGDDVDAVFLQQADDAIVWWDVPVALHEPDWLEEPLDPAVNPNMRWYPVTTFLNLAVDMAVATAFDEDQGHMYGTQPALAWRTMIAPEAYLEDDQAFDRLLDTLEKIPRTV